jgi:hypothetical protein
MLPSPPQPMTRQLQRFTIDFRPGSKLGGAVTTDQLDGLNKQLGSHCAHLARAQRPCDYLETDGHYTVVGTDPTEVASINEALRTLGFELQPLIHVERPSGRREKHSHYTFIAACFVSAL